MAREELQAGVDDRFEDRLRVGRRTADHPEDLGGGGLLLERFPGLVEQPRVLDRDHGLVGEGLHQVDVGLGERLDPAAQQRDHADRLAIAQHRHRQHRAEAVTRLELAHVGVLGVDERNDVLDMQQPALEERTPADRRAAQRQLVLACRGRARSSAIARSLSPGDEQPHAAAFRLAEQPGALGDGVQHRLHVGRRSADHLQHLGRRGLPLERLLGLVEQAHVLDRDHRLVGEGREQLDLLVGERRCTSWRQTTITPTTVLPLSIGTPSMVR